MMPLPFILAAFAARIESWMQGGSYFVLFGLLFACGLGLPLPEDIPLLIAGALIAKGKMSLALAAVCAWCGIIGGDMVLYHLGRFFGMEVRKLPVIGGHLSEKRMEQVHGMFEKWGVWVVAVGRMFAGIRGAMVVVAGAIRFTRWKFILADGLAAVVSGGLFLSLGYLFGAKMDVLLHHVEQGKKWAMLAALVLAIGVGVWIYLRGRRRQATPHIEGEAENPEPHPVRTPDTSAK